MLSRLSKANNTNGTTAPPTTDPAAPTLPVRRQRGEQYAQALTEFKELENALDDAVAKLDDAMALIKVLEGTLAAVQHDNGQLLSDRDWHRDRYVELRTQLNSIAQQFSDCIRANPQTTVEHTPEQAKQISSALTEVEKELLAKVEQQATQAPV